MTRRARHVIAPKLQRELLKHPGKWVAITRKRLLAFGDSPLEVLAAARALGVKMPILHRVADPDVSWFFAR